MDYRTEVQNGKDSHLLISGGSDPGNDSLLQGFNSLEEAWTPKKLAQHNDGYNEASSTGGALNFDLQGTWKMFKGWFHTRGPVKNITKNRTMLMGCPEIVFEEGPNKKRWKEIAKDNDFPGRWIKIIRNTTLFNDYFTWVGTAGNIEGTGKPSDVKIRNFEPFHIESVLTEEGDPETIIGYKCQNSAKVYKPDEVVHHILEDIGNDNRGVPALNCVGREITYLYKWMEDLYYMGHIRARFPVVREVAGTQSQVDSEKDRFQYLPGPGRMLLQNQGYKTTFPPAYSGVGDAEPGMMVWYRAIASGSNLPLFLVTSDYTNNSLASTLSADSPTIRFIKDDRKTIEPQIRAIVERATGTDDFEINWPPIVERDKEKDAKAFQVGIDKGAVSPQTMCETVYGLDWKEEDARIKAHKKDISREFLPGADV